jgi:arginyl-tRNA--protein-N-Asp/Glu arginylyltransferase
MTNDTINRCYQVLMGNGFKKTEIHIIAQPVYNVSEREIEAARLLYEANASIKTIAGFLSRNYHTVKHWKQCNWNLDTYRLYKRAHQ